MSSRGSLGNGLGYSLGYGRNECISDYRLDRWLLQELNNVDSRTVQRHVQNCTLCEERVSAIQLAQKTWAEEAIPAWTDFDRTGSVWSKIWNIFAGRRPSLVLTFATLAAIFFWLLPVNEEPSRSTGHSSQEFLASHSNKAPELRSNALEYPSIAPEHRSKGVSIVGYVIEHEGLVRSGMDSDTIFPGDRLRFSYRLERPKYLLIFSVDAQQEISIFHPQGEDMEQEEPSRLAWLPTGVEMDDVLGLEQIYAITCESPRRITPFVRQFLESRDPEHIADDCVVQLIRLQKTKRSEDRQSTGSGILP